MVFGLVKKRLQRVYVENGNVDLLLTVSQVINTFRSFESIFRKCGYSETGFNAGVAFELNLNEMGFET